MINSFSQNISKFISSILQQYLNQDQNFKIDSFIFAKKIKECTNANMKRMIGLDIENLFPSIPLNESCNIAADILKSTCFPQMKYENILKILDFCTKDITFEFDGKFFKQINGVPMGSPLSMALSELFLRKLETEKIFPFMNAEGIRNYYRYVDDIFLITDSNVNSFQISTWFNTLHSKLIFTFEDENVDNSLNFLDVLVIRYKNLFETRTFRKKIHPLKMCDWNSCIALKYKLNLLKNMIDRTYKICSRKFLQDDLLQLKLIFLNSHYPLKVVEKALHERYSLLIQKKDTIYPEQKVINFGFTYNNFSISKFSNKILKVSKKFLPGCVKVRNYYRRAKTILSMFSRKYKNYKKESLPCVYKINCLDCPLSYIGETGRTISIRTKEHSRLKEKSALSDHFHETQHKIDFDNPRILITEHNSHKRKILEKLFQNDIAHFSGNKGIDLMLFHD